MPRVDVTPHFLVVWLLVGAVAASDVRDRRIEQVTQLDPLTVTTARIPWAWVLAAGVGVALVYALSILAHELGHFVAAKLLRADVDGITLHATGGFVELADDAWLSDRRFSLIVAAGPCVTALLLVAAYTLHDHDFPETFAGIVADRIATAALWTNAIALVINLFPFRGLDGWHLLTSARWFQRLG